MLVARQIGARRTAPALTQNLATVFAKGSRNRLHHTVIEQPGSTQIPFPFLADANIAVTGSRGAVFHLAGCGQAEPFFGAFMRF